jgi:predicted DNA-binding protein
MASSINQDIRVGRSVYHLQTEFYHSSGKIVTVIFKDGASVKRLERSISLSLTDEEIDEELKRFHQSVVDRLLGRKPSIPVSSPPKEVSFKLPEELHEEVLRLLAPHFGIATNFIVEEVVSNSRSADEFVQKITEDLDEKVARDLREKLKALLSALSSTGGFTVTPEIEDAILSVLRDFFGIMAYPVLEDSLEEWRKEKGGYKELVEIICSHAHSENESLELKKRLLSLEF